MKDEAILPVEQCDREAAAKYTSRGHGWLEGYTFSADYMIRNGHWDDDPLVQAFARARHATLDRAIALVGTAPDRLRAGTSTVRDKHYRQMADFAQRELREMKGSDGG